MIALLRRYLRQVDALYLVLCAACSAISVVVLVSIGQTQLGSNNKASVQLIARLLDSLGKAEGILGTIAGDDTIFTTPARGFSVKQLYEAILLLFEQEL